MLSQGSVDAAAEFYSRWHISADAVAEARVVLITSPQALATQLMKHFDPERLIASGIASEKGHLYIDSRHPVIEPHVLPMPGFPASALQFRGSVETERRVAEHKAYKAARKEAEAAGRTYRGPKVDYVPKFMSLRGASLTARCGFGLPRLAQVAEEMEAARARGETPKPKRVWIVEGAKDLLAARTLGLEAYGLAGAGLLPVRAVCKLIGKIGPAAVALDGDEGGEVGRERLIAHFEAHGVEAIAKPPPDGKDMTDVLVDKTKDTANA